MRPRTLYGWRLSDGRFCLSRLPPDQPQVPVHCYDSIPAAEEAAQERHRKPPRIIWSGSAAAEKYVQECQASR